MHEYYQPQPRRVREEMKELMEKGRNFINEEK